MNDKIDDAIKATEVVEIQRGIFITVNEHGMPENIHIKGVGAITCFGIAEMIRLSGERLLAVETAQRAERESRIIKVPGGRIDA